MTAASRWVVVAMIVGAALGYLFPDGAHLTAFHASSLQVLSTVFLRLIKCLIAPLLFATLVGGIAGHGEDLKRVGRLALRSILYFEFATTLALVVGLVAVNLVKPGIGVNLAGTAGEAGVQLARTQPSFSAVLEHAVPQSFFEAAAGNEALQITLFSILFAIALMQVRGPAKQLILTGCESLSEVMFKLTGIVMKLAPIGIGAAIATTVGRSGLGTLRNLGALVLTLYGALIAFALFVLLPIAIACKVPLRRFWQAMRGPSVIAFTTASSEAAFPLALRNMEWMGVPRSIVSFVLPAGYAFNMDGTTLYLSLASIFVAQAAGIHLPLSQQILMMLTLMLTSKGLAAVPRVSLVVLSTTLTQFGLPLSGVAVILGVDAFMDMARTSVNLVGNCLAAVLMARWEGTFDCASPQTQEGGVMEVGSFASVRPIMAGDVEPALPALVELLRDTVNGGASLGFWAPLCDDVAREYWRSLRPQLEDGSRILLGAFSDDQLVGSAQLALPCWPNAPHRAEVQKVLVAPGKRGQGVGRSLMAALHGVAWQQGRSLLILNARQGGPAVGFYKGLGYQEVGVVPGYTVGPAGERYDNITLYQQLAL